MANVPSRPPGYHTVTTYITVKDARQAIDFYRRAFGAELTMKLDMPDGRIAHAEVRIGDTHIMLADENEQWGNRSPVSYGGSPASLMIYVPDVDAAFKRALDAGGEQVRPVQDQFYGDRAGTLKDPSGFMWTLATHIEDVSEAEGQRRMNEMMAQA